MSVPHKANVVTDNLWVLGLAFGLPVLAMLLFGLDANWDLQNYHLYNVHAWLNGRMETDIAPANTQTWHNPLLDVPLYLIVTSGLSARWASAWLTLPYIASLFFLLRLQLLLSPTQPSRFSQSILALVAVTGAATYSTLATSTNDGFVAAGILASLFLVVQPDQGRIIHQRWVLAGLVAGAITGLKLAAIFYCFGLAFSALIGGGWKDRLARLFSLAVGGATGFVLTYGYWAWRLFAEHRNPFFPYYNNFFLSPNAAPRSFADERFHPDSLIDAVLSPVQLLFKSSTFSELTLSDPRLLLGLLSLAILYVLHRKNALHGVPNRVRFGMLLCFFVVSFLLWSVQYGIYRYAIVLELLGSLALVVLLQYLPRGRNLALFIAALLVSADTRRPDWGHVRSTAPMAGILPAAIPDDSLVLIASQDPLGYLALGLPDSVPLVAVSNGLMSPDLCTPMQLRTKDAVARHVGPIWLLSGNEAGNQTGQAIISQYYGLQSAGTCLPFPSSFGAARLCPQKRIAAPNLCEFRISLTVIPASLESCGPGVEGSVTWSVQGTVTPITATEILVGSPGVSLKLMGEGGLAGTVKTGPWNVPGVRYVLKSKDSGKTLARVVVDGPACAALR